MMMRLVYIFLTYNLVSKLLLSGKIMQASKAWRASP
mgnify:CR=1 FL=1